MHEHGSPKTLPLRGNLCGATGDCDSDHDCAYGLKCFQRNGKGVVTGCSPGGSDDSAGYDFWCVIGDARGCRRLSSGHSPRACACSCAQ